MIILIIGAAKEGWGHRRRPNCEKLLVGTTYVVHKPNDVVVIYLSCITIHFGGGKSQQIRLIIVLLIREHFGCIFGETSFVFDGGSFDTREPITDPITKRPPPALLGIIIKIMWL